MKTILDKNVINILLAPRSNEVEEKTNIGYHQQV